MRPEFEHGPTGIRRVPLAVSMGDPAGIGLEITLKAWAARESEGLAPFVLFADPIAVAERARTLRLSVPIAPIESLAVAAETFKTALPLRTVTLPVRARPGVPDPANAPAVIGAIEQATASVAAGQAAALVTNPIAKHVVAGPNFPYPGHTEFLAALAQRHWPRSPFRAVMMLAAKGFRVVPYTVHCRLADVPAAITREGVAETVRITHEALQRDFGIRRPRIAVTGLNPHAGEEGSMGREEIEAIAPAIGDLCAEGLDVTGPHPADTLFHAAARATYDAAVCMYHDQALIPFKTIAFEDGVNVTLGLPFVRTSPDHGTAFDIAGARRASAKSFIEAVKLAAAIAAARAAAASA
jgi:4-hydroxythreonine-4-phosphate dehydrogenase